MFETKNKLLNCPKWGQFNKQYLVYMFMGHIIDNKNLVLCLVNCVFFFLNNNLVESKGVNAFSVGTCVPESFRFSGINYWYGHSHLHCCSVTVINGSTRH